MRTTGLHPAQIWVPGIRTSSFTEECRRQCKVIAGREETGESRADAKFWEGVTADG